MKEDPKDVQESKFQGLFERVGIRISEILSQYTSGLTTSQFKIGTLAFGALFASVCLSLIIRSLTGQDSTPPFSIQKITQPPVSRKDSIRHQQAIILRRLLDKLEKTPQASSLFDNLMSPKPTNRLADSTARPRPDFLH